MGIFFESKRILIWGKTYPELSTKSRETVCTGGCLEDGTPIRLYPVDLRYLARHKQYDLYDWIEVPIARNLKDPRPESYKVRADEIQVVGSVKPGGAWSERREVIFKNRTWHFDCLEDLKKSQATSLTSMGVVRVGKVNKVELKDRPASDLADHKKKLAALKAKPDLFGIEQKDLQFIPYRIRLHWCCAGLTGGLVCPGHTASILDWGLLELGRRDGPEKAKARMEELTRLDVYDLYLYMGNLFTRQHIFSIIGLWYPKHQEQTAFL